MDINRLDNAEIWGQMNLSDLFAQTEKLFAVSRIFARARKTMNLVEQKTFVYALTQFRFTEELTTDYVKLDKKVLAKILGYNSDIDHLSENLYEAIKDLPAHSYIEINEKDIDLRSNGFVISSITSFKNVIRLKFNSEYMGFFTGLSTDYITMWSSDIFQMTSKRSVQFYEYLRQITDTRDEVNSIGLGVKALKEMFDIPETGEGSYMRDKDKGGFDRTNFEKYVIYPLVNDLKNCKMINLIVQPDGKYYEKVKKGNRVQGYRFYWTFSAYPKVATAKEVHKIQKRVDANPEILKVAKDLIEGKPKRRKRQKKEEQAFNNFEQRQYNFEDLEKGILNQQQD